jgi:hypothetical protein
LVKGDVEVSVLAERVIRIGSGGGFWGDRPLAPIELLKRENLDYLMIDYLAELTLSIMSKQKRRDARSGWATDLELWLEAGGIDLLRRKSVKLVTNAGGANPKSCAKMVLELANRNGWHDCKVGVVTGDDLLPNLGFILENGEDLSNLESGEGILESGAEMMSANAYLGAGPIASALELGADIVITGRVADASLAVGSMLHSAGWATNAFANGLNHNSTVAEWAPDGIKNPLDILAQWTIAGHLIECGAQVSGGNSSDWSEVPSLTTLTLPIAEIRADGNVRITRARGSGGMVNRRVVAEQLVYEIGNPAKYITPDVICDLRNVTIEDVEEDVVEVAGTRGLPEPLKLKVSGAIEGGWFAASSLLVSGPDAIEKAKVADSTLRGRLADCEDMEIYTEFIGAGITLPTEIRKLVLPHLNPPEITLRMAVASPNRDDIILFSQEVAPLVLTGPAGIGGYGARPRPRRQLQFWPSLISREFVNSSVRVDLITHLKLSQEGERFHYIRQRTRNLISRLQDELDEREWAKPIAKRLGRDKDSPANKSAQEREVKG